MVPSYFLSHPLWSSLLGPNTISLAVHFQATQYKRTDDDDDDDDSNNN
jgi:hypothetical protein